LIDLQRVLAFQGLKRHGNQSKNPGRTPAHPELTHDEAQTSTVADSSLGAATGEPRQLILVGFHRFTQVHQTSILIQARPPDLDPGFGPEVTQDVMGNQAAPGALDTYLPFINLDPFVQLKIQARPIEARQPSS